VYTPPGYSTSGIRYPVLYLLHGSGDDDTAWITAGRANFLLDHLIAARRVVPMIAVIPSSAVPPPASAARPADPFRFDLVRDVIPFVRLNYRVKPFSADTA